MRALINRQTVSAIEPLSLPLWPLARFAVGICIGLVALWWVGRGLDWGLTLQALGSVRPAWVIMAVLGVVAVALAKAARWRGLYRAISCSPSYGVLFSGLMAAQAINLIIPIRLGELVRLGWMKQAGQPGAGTLSTILLEKVIDLLAAGLVACTLIILEIAPGWLVNQTSSIWLLSLTLVGSLVLICRLQGRFEQWLAGGLARAGWLPKRWQKWVVYLARRTLEALRILAGWRSLLSVLGWTLIIWALSLLTIIALFSSFKLNLPLVAAALIVLAVSSSNIAPSPPALVGVIPLIAVIVLEQYEVARVVAVGFGFALNIVTVGPILILGGWALGFHTISVLAWLRWPWLKEMGAE